MANVVKVYGGNELRGEVDLIPNKNSFLPAIAASILSDRPIKYLNVPDTSDVSKLLDLIKDLGGDYEKEGDIVTINCSGVNKYEVGLSDGKSIRASLLFVGPLLARFGKAIVPMPGGCKLGFRGIGSHVEFFRKMGVLVSIETERVVFTDPNFGVADRKERVFCLDPSVTASENLIMYAVGISGETIITGSAQEPHVHDLIVLLRNMGADILPTGMNDLRVVGKGMGVFKEATYTARPDFVDFCGYCVAAAVTGGEIRIKGGNIPEVMTVIMEWLSLFNIEFIVKGEDVVVRKKKGEDLFIDHHGMFPMAGPRLPKLAPRPWPGFPVDCLPMILPLAAKLSRGQLLLMNWMYEDGLQLVRELTIMGASIFYASPIRVIVNAKDSEFKGIGTVTPPTVIQSVKAIFLAALAAEPGSCFTIYNFGFLKRRYPDVVEKYTKLGAKIEVIE